MKSFFIVLFQLALVTVVYAFAYRAGYRAAQSKAVSVVREFANPVTCLLDQLKDSIDEAVEGEDDHPTSDIKDSNDQIAAKSSSGGSKEDAKVDL